MDKKTLFSQTQKLLIDFLPYSVTQGQIAAIEKLAKFVTDINDKHLMLLKGYAGTGKTTLIASLVKTLKKIAIPCVLLAPTGRAAKVLTNYCQKTAYTIHKQIYRQKTTFGDFVLTKNTFSETIFIVDEASMISNETYDGNIFGSGHLLNDLIEYVYSGEDCRLMLVGDTAQLLPVGEQVSPAMSEYFLNQYYRIVLESILTDVVRQNKTSGILENATQIRRNITEINSILKIETNNFNDVAKISGVDIIEQINEAYEKYGMEETKIICRSNQRANRYNQGIRKKILFREEEISENDYLMVVKNNYFWLENLDEKIEKPTTFIANGDIAQILKIKKYEERYGFRFANVSLRFPDYNDFEIDTKIFLDTLFLETPSLSWEEQKKLFSLVEEDYFHIKNKQQRYRQIKENEFFNALQVKFAYAVTCHKAQGGQWKAAFIDGHFPYAPKDIDFLRWLYTAFTRPTEKLFLVNFNTEFF